MSNEVLPVRTYVVVFVLLLLLLAATVVAAYVNLGPLNAVVSLSIAALKALLVILFFMHVRSSSRVVWVYVLVGFLWLALLIGGTLADYYTRGGLALIGP